MNKYNELYPSNWTNAAHTKNGSATSSNQLFYDNHWNDDSGHSSKYMIASGSGQFDYTNPLPKGVRYVDVSIWIYRSCSGSSSQSISVTDSSGKTVAYGSSHLDLSAYANSKEDLYLHVYASSRCEENVGYGGIATYASVSSIRLSY